MMTSTVRRLVPILVIVWTSAITTARAIRLPNDFSEAHWLLDYRFGFMKRGLIGSICSGLMTLIGRQMTPHIIVVLSAVTYMCFFAAMFLLLWRSLHRHAMEGNAQLTALIFASSPFLVMNAHLFGYFDALLYVFAIAAAALTLLDRPFLAALISVIAILSHESYILIGFPLVCLATVLFLLSHGSRSRWPAHVMALCLPLLTFASVPLLQSLASDRIVLRQQLTEYLDASGFVATRSKGVAEWQTTTALEFFRSQWQQVGMRLLAPGVLANIAPSLLAILYFIYSSLRVQGFSLLSVVLLVAVCSPLAMHMVAWDTSRISTYTLGGSFIAWWILTETREPQKTPNALALLAVPAILVNVFGRIPLMDDEVERFSHVERLLLYTPAFILLLTVVVNNLAPEFAAGLRKKRTPITTMSHGKDSESSPDSR